MASDFVLKLDGINEVLADGSVVPVPIEILSFSWGANTASSSGGGGGHRSHEPMYMRKAGGDPMSAILYKAAVTGRVFKTGQLTITPRSKTEKGSPYFKFWFTDVLISSISYEGNERGADMPTETLVLEPHNVEVGLIVP